MAKQTSPVRMADRKSAGKQKAKDQKPRPKTDIRQQIKIQKALYEIADAASAVTDMHEFYAALHRIVGKLMYAKSFYVTLYDAATGALSSPYFADESGDTAPPPAKIDSSNKSLRGIVLLTGKTLHVSGEEIEEGRRRGKFTPMGTPAEDWIGVPLKTGGRVVGMLTVQSYKKGIRYGEQDVRLIEFVAQHMAVALTRARAIDETRQRNAELQIINSVQEGLASKLDIQKIYDLVGDKIRDVFSAQGVSIASYDPVANLLHFHYSIQEGEHIQYDPAPLSDKGFRAHIIRTGRSLRLDDVEIQGTEYGLVTLKPANVTTVAKSDAPKSWLGVPLLMGGKVGGVVNLYNVDRTNAYSDLDMHLLETLANSMSIALENARLFDETQSLLKETEQRAAELAIINSVQEGLASKLDLQAIYDLVGEKIRGTFDADVVGIGLYDHEHGMMTYPYLVDHGERYFPKPAPVSSRLMNYMKTSGVILVHTYEEASRFMSEWGIENVGGPTPDNSYMALPLFTGNQFIGRITVAKLPAHAFNESDVRLLQTLTNSMSVALENARLFDETQRLLKETEQRAAELAIINSVQEGLASKLDMQAIYELVGDKIHEIFHNTDTSIRVYDPTTNQIHFPYLFENGKYITLDPIPMPERGFTYHVLQTRKSLVINENMAQAAEKYGAFVLPGRQMEKSNVIVPLVIGGQARGVIDLSNQERENAFSDSDVRLLETLANSMSVALENARLFDETQRLLKETEQRAAELAVINRVQEGLASKLDYHAIVDLVGDTIREIFHVQSLSIGRYDHTHAMVDYSYVVQKGQRAHFEPMSFSGVSKHIIHTRQTLVVGENVKAKMDELGSHWGDLEIPKTLIYVPLIAGEMVTGVVAIYDYERENAFNDSDIRLLQTLSNAMSVALENARLWEQEKFYRKALQRELEIGREIQAGFLPEILPKVEGWEIAASLMSAREVAGDFYDAFELPDGMIGLVIADVCDKGVGAALFMTLFRSLIRAASNLEYFEHTESVASSHSTAERLQRAVQLTNNYIAETHGDSGMFATLFFGILDPRDGRLVYINGGHEPPLLLHVDGRNETLQKTGPAVGAITDGHFDLSEATLQEGDIFLAFTDGVPDCKDPHGEFYGRKRLLDIFRESKGSAQGLVDCIETDLHQYIATAIQFDDITLLAMRRV